MSMESNAKVYSLQQHIQGYIKEGTLSEKMDVLRLQAAELGLDDQHLRELITEAQAIVQKEQQVATIGQRNKTLISVTCIAVVVIEWILGLMMGGFSLGKIIGLLVINILSILIVVFAISALINKKIQK